MRTWGVLIIALVLAVPGVARGQTELRNDGFESGQQATFQGGFVAGEIAASSLTAPVSGTRLLAVRLLFGSTATTQSITLHVWDDTAAGMTPGAELYSGDFQLVGSATAMHELDLSAENVVVTARFRVGIELQHAGLPSVAKDEDGTISAADNFLYADLGASSQWFRSQTLGLTGDWVIRGVIMNSSPVDAGVDGATPIDAGLDADPAVDAAAGVDAPSAACEGNPDCAEGTYCDTSIGACTFDCREDRDCPAGICNSLGRCVADDGDGGGGCCDGGGAQRGAGTLVLAVVVALLAYRPRRASVVLRPRR